MQFLQFDKCCCCVDLRTGSLILGYLNLIGGFALFVLSIFSFIVVIDYLQGQRYLYWQDIVAGILVGAVMVFTFISLVFTVMLLFGLHKFQPRYIRPYIIFNGVLLVFKVLNIILEPIVNMTTIGSIISNILSLFITAYFLLVIRSYWLQLKETGPPLTTGVIAVPQTVQPAPIYPTPAGYPAPAAMYSQQTAQPQSYVVTEKIA